MVVSLFPLKAVFKVLDLLGAVVGGHTKAPALKMPLSWFWPLQGASASLLPLKLAGRSAPLRHFPGGQTVFKFSF